MLKTIIPDWALTYKKDWFKGDLAAGLTVGIMLIPQGMAYAGIAGLPPVYGLYAAMIPQLIYAILGTSRQLAVGPVAMDSLLVAAGVSVMATGGTESYLQFSFLLAFLMGALQFLFGTFRLGFLVNFLSKPVINGFTSAAAIIIGLNQVKHLTGLNVNNDSIVTILHDTFTKILEINPFTFLIGVLGIVIILAVKKYKFPVPGALLVVVLGVLVTYLFHLDRQGVKIVGDIPQGFPAFKLHIFDLEVWKQLFPVALTLSLIAFMEAISVAKAIETKHRNEYQINANKELIAIGASNIVGSFFACYPTTGGFSRSAVNDTAGANTPLAAIISSIIVGLTLLFLTPLFYYLPNAILASVILTAVATLMDFSYPKTLWKTDKQEFFMLMVTFVVTLFVGITEGILVGVALALLLLIYRSARPHYAVLGRLPGTKDFRNTSRFKNIETRKDVLIFRFDAEMFFANIGYFKETLTTELKKQNETKLLILHMGSIHRIDPTALQGLEEKITELTAAGVCVYFTGLIGPVRDYLHSVGFIQQVGEDHFFMDADTAIQYFDKQDNPYMKVHFRNALQSSVFKG